jgi:hypothetical protein
MFHIIIIHCFEGKGGKRARRVSHFCSRKIYDSPCVLISIFERAKETSLRCTTPTTAEPAKVLLLGGVLLNSLEQFQVFFSILLCSELLLTRC